MLDELRAFPVHPTHSTIFYSGSWVENGIAAVHAVAAMGGVQSFRQRSFGACKPVQDVANAPATTQHCCSETMIPRAWLQSAGLPFVHPRLPLRGNRPIGSMALRRTMCVSQPSPSVRVWAKLCAAPAHRYQGSRCFAAILPTHVPRNLSPTWS